MIGWGIFRYFNTNIERCVEGLVCQTACLKWKHFRKKKKKKKKRIYINTNRNTTGKRPTFKRNTTSS
jgi:Fe-S-cluster-containing dehydrogenase component